MPGSQIVGTENKVKGKQDARYLGKRTKAGKEAPASLRFSRQFSRSLHATILEPGTG